MPSPDAPPCGAPGAAPANPAALAARTHSPIFVEVFCGVARLSQAARERGFHAVPVDHVVKAHGIRVLQLDLRSRTGQRMLRDLVGQTNVVWVHWAPPCGTFSRAREIKRKGAPPPLRSQHLVKGLKRLTANQQAQIGRASCRERVCQYV